MNLARFSVRNPVTANLLMFAVIAGGIWSAFNLRRDLFPAVDPEAVVVTVVYPGATPEEVERLVARPIERAVDTIEDVDEISAQIFEGLVSVRIEMQDGTDPDRALGDVRSAMDTVRADLPDDAEEPSIRQLRPILPVISVVVRGAVSEERLREAAKRVRDDLLDLTPSSEISIAGIRDREIWIEIAPERLEEYGLTFEEVGRVLAGSNLDLPAGQLKSRAGNIRVRTLGESNRASGIARLLVKSLPDGTAVRLSDVATVRETFEDRVERGDQGGKRAALVTVFKTPEEDAISIAAQVKEYVARSNAPFAGAIELETTRDLSRFIRQRIDLMVRNALIGLLLVMITLGVFLEFRIAFWVAVGLSVSFLGTFLLMSQLDVTINLISMFGLIVVLGLLVDDAIVIAENVLTRRRGSAHPRQAVIDGANEVAGPVVAAVATTICAFLPLAFLTGRIGAFLGVLPVVVICALLVSLFEAFVVLPSHLAHGEREPGRGVFGRFVRRVSVIRRLVLEQRLRSGFAVILDACLKWRYVTLASVVAMAMAAAGLVFGGFVPFVLLGSTDAETIQLELEMAPGTSERETALVLSGLETLVNSYEEVDLCFAVIGTAFEEGRQRNVSDPATVGQLTIELIPADERLARGLRRSQPVVNDLRRETHGIPGVRRLLVAPQGGGPQGADIEVRLRGEDLDMVKAATEHVQRILGSYEGVNEVYDDLVEGKLELRVRLREEARALRLRTRDVALQLRHALLGYEVQDLQDEDEEVTVRVLLPESGRARIEDLARLRIATPDGGRVPLAEVAEFTTARGYSTLSRVDGKRAFSVFAGVDEDTANVSRITEDLVGNLADMEERFPGVTYSFQGRKEDMRESLSGLKAGFGVAVLLIYGIVAILFRSYVQPVLVMTAIPISFIGVVFGHVLLGYPLTLLSMIGSVALAGIVVNDSLILVNLINHKRDEGRPIKDAVMTGSKARLRAILLTSVTTIAGLGPLLLETSFQAQFLIPMAIAICFGLAFATILVLVVIPCFYMALDDLRRLLRWYWFGSRPVPVSPVPEPSSSPPDA